MNLHVYHPIGHLGVVHVLSQAMIVMRRHRLVEVTQTQRQQRIPDIGIEQPEREGTLQRRRGHPDLLVPDRLLDGREAVMRFLLILGIGNPPLPRHMLQQEFHLVG